MKQKIRDRFRLVGEEPAGGPAVCLHLTTGGAVFQWDAAASLLTLRGGRRYP